MKSFTVLAITAALATTAVCKLELDLQLDL